MYVDRHVCWGYETNCTEKWRYSSPTCTGPSHGWAKTKKEQQDRFYNEGDFGYIRRKIDELFYVCKPKTKDGSSLECSNHLRICRGRNIYFDFSSLRDLPRPVKYRMDIIQRGLVGGACNVNYEALKENLDHMSPLQSWAPELQHFTELPDSLMQNADLCDVIVDDPTYIMKLDATVNMYHHFCDFFNLYASLHFNNTFTSDIRILLWDVMAYHSNFGQTWKAFTQHSVQDLNQYIGKKVCFRDVILPFLPRMIFGMFYNMPLISGCEGSGLFHAFSHHVIHRLDISKHPPEPRKIRVTLLSRSTSYRRILNEDQLIKALESDGNEFQVRKVDFTWNTPFLEQLKVIHNTDILIGIHGAGLTHLLFLPDWGAIFEIYNCEDESCYKDLARLRGVTYATWEKLNKLKPEDGGHHPTEGAHAKFTNYEFDVKEFLRIVHKLAEQVKSHPLWSKSVQTSPDNSIPQHAEL